MVCQRLCGSSGILCCLLLVFGAFLLLVACGGDGGFAGAFARMVLDWLDGLHCVVGRTLPRRRGKKRGSVSGCGVFESSSSALFASLDLFYLERAPLCVYSGSGGTFSYSHSRSFVLSGYLVPVPLFSSNKEDPGFYASQGFSQYCSVVVYLLYFFFRSI